jgi:hypothetical protein
MTSEAIFLPAKGLSKLGPVLKVCGVGRPAYKAGENAGTFPPPRIPSRKPGSPDLYDCAQVWAVVEGKDWRTVNSASLQTNDDE